MRLRDAAARDAPELAALLNAVIAIGGTTAHEEPFSPDAFLTHFIAGPQVLCCIVAEADGVLLGFQGLARDFDDRPGWGDIATFARPDPKVHGVGTALFGATRARLAQLGVRTVNATIRADNVPGLAYYARMGFVTYDCVPAVRLRDGTPVDRIAKRFDAGFADGSLP